MQLHQIKPNSRLKKSQRIGRGGKRGAYSGRGLKGQKSRAGAKIRPQVRDLMMKLPKQRGVSFKSLKTKPEVVNLSRIEKWYQEGQVVNLKTLNDRGLISGKSSLVKILASGDLEKKLVFEGVKLSKSSQEKIQKSGGTIK